MAIKKFQNGSSEWLDFRTKFVTGTEVASLFGFNPNLSAARVLKEKISPSPRFDNKWMRAGRLLEPSVFIALNEAGIPAVPADRDNVVFLYDEKLRIGSSLDGKMNVAEGFYIVECKTTNGDKFETWLENPPINYLLQVQTQLLVAGVDKALLAVLCYEFPFPLIVYEVKASEEVHEMIRSAVYAFWKQERDGIPYKVDKEDKETLKNLIFKGIEKIYIDFRS